MSSSPPKNRDDRSDSPEDSNNGYETAEETPNNGQENAVCVPQRISIPDEPTTKRARAVSDIEVAAPPTKKTRAGSQQQSRASNTPLSEQEIRDHLEKSYANEAFPSTAELARLSNVLRTNSSVTKAWFDEQRNARDMTLHPNMQLERHQPQPQFFPPSEPRSNTPRDLEYPLLEADTALNSHQTAPVSAGSTAAVHPHFGSLQDALVLPHNPPNSSTDRHVSFDGEDTAEAADGANILVRMSNSLEHNQVGTMAAPRVLQPPSVITGVQSSNNPQADHICFKYYRPQTTSPAIEAGCIRAHSYIGEQTNIPGLSACGNGPLHQGSGELKAVAKAAATNPYLVKKGKPTMENYKAKLARYDTLSPQEQVEFNIFSMEELVARFPSEVQNQIKRMREGRLPVGGGMSTAPNTVSNGMHAANNTTGSGINGGLIGVQNANPGAVIQFRGGYNNGTSSFHNPAAAAANTAGFGVSNTMSTPPASSRGPPLSSSTRYRAPSTRFVNTWAPVRTPGTGSSGGINRVGNSRPRAILPRPNSVQHNGQPGTGLTLTDPLSAHRDAIVPPSSLATPVAYPAASPAPNVNSMQPTIQHGTGVTTNDQASARRLANMRQPSRANAAVLPAPAPARNASSSLNAQQGARSANHLRRLQALRACRELINEEIAFLESEVRD